VVDGELTWSNAQVEKNAARHQLLDEKDPYAKHGNQGSMVSPYFSAPIPVKFSRGQIARWGYIAD